MRPHLRKGGYRVGVDYEIKVTAHLDDSRQSRRGLRFGDIKSRVEASSTTVSRRLKELEHYGLVQRKAHPNSTAGSLYTLREDAEKLSPIMQSLFDWAETWNVE